MTNPQHKQHDKSTTPLRQRKKTKQGTMQKPTQRNKPKDQCKKEHKRSMQGAMENLLGMETPKGFLYN